MADDEKIIKLPVKFIARDTENQVEKVQNWEKVKNQKCTHENATYAVDESEGTVECGKCGTVLDPIWVLLQIVRKESKYHQAHERYVDEMRRLGKRSKTKCKHCGRMTYISRR